MNRYRTGRFAAKTSPLKLVRAVVASGIGSEEELIQALDSATGDKLWDAIGLLRFIEIPEAVPHLRILAGSEDRSIANLAKFVLARYDPRVPLYLHWLRMPNMQFSESLHASAQALAQTYEPESFRLVGAYLLDPDVGDWIKEEVARYFHRNFSVCLRQSDKDLDEAAGLLHRAVEASESDLALVLLKFLFSIEAPSTPRWAESYLPAARETGDRERAAGVERLALENWSYLV
ncbi:hypothetical protein EON79_14920 [bacterium]|nr:MAG: hypothetical protein EON79_14920 [bacterium]